mgnify:CR=1 FL=1
MSCRHLPPASKLKASSTHPSTLKKEKIKDPLWLSVLNELLKGLSSNPDEFMRGQHQRRDKVGTFGDHCAR